MSSLYPMESRVTVQYQTLDIRQVPRSEQLLKVLQAFEALKRGGAFVLMADSGATDVYNHIRLEIQERCEVTVLTRAEDLWKVLIKRTG